jgi:polyisoprenoid-binding protein YceI
MKHFTARTAAAVLLIYTSVAIAAARPLRVDYGASSVEIHGKAAGFFPATFRFDQFEAALQLGADGTQVTEATFQFRYDEITSGSTGKDKKVRDWLEAETYPIGTFTSERVETENGTTYLVGPLQLHGQSHPARFRCEVVRRDGQVNFLSQATIDYSDWGLPDLRIFAFKVQQELEIRVALSGVLTEG